MCTCQLSTGVMNRIVQRARKSSDLDHERLPIQTARPVTARRGQKPKLLRDRCSWEYETSLAAEVAARAAES